MVRLTPCRTPSVASFLCRQGPFADVNEGNRRQMAHQDAGCTRVQQHMHYKEYQQLEGAYAEAVRHCSQYASPQPVVPPGKDQLQRATALRQDALVQRNSAD